MSSCTPLGPRNVASCKYYVHHHAVRVPEKESVQHIAVVAITNTVTWVVEYNKPVCGGVTWCEKLAKEYLENQIQNVALNRGLNGHGHPGFRPNKLGNSDISHVIKT